MHAEAVVTMETPPQWRVVEVVAMEDQRRWKGMFDYIQKFGEYRNYPLTMILAVVVKVIFDDW